MYLVDEVAVIFIESDLSDTSIELLEVTLNGARVRSKRQNFKEIIARAEVESWEESTLGVKVAIKQLLAVLKLRLEASKLAG